MGLRRMRRTAPLTLTLGQLPHPVRGVRVCQESSTVGAAMPTSKVHPARSVVPAATVSKSTKLSAKKPAAANAKTSIAPSAVKACPEISKSLEVLGGEHEKVGFDRGPVGI